MSDLNSWDIVHESGTGQILLGVDFPLHGRRPAGFGELATKMGSGFGFLQTKLRAPCAGRRPSCENYIGPWIEDVRDFGRPVAAVFGYYVGSVYAAAIAERISRWQPAPKLVLFDPQLAGVRLLGRELHREITANQALLSDDELECARKVADEVAAAQAADVAQVAAEMMDCYLSLMTAPYERAGLGSARGSRWHEPFESYISWISAAGQIDPRLTWTDSGAIVSADYPGLLETGPAGAGDTVTVVGRWIRAGVADADLLRSDAVAGIVLALLAS